VSTPVLSGGKVITGFSDGFLVALKAGDGSEVWIKNLAENKNAVFKDVDVQPIVKNGIIYTASFQGGVFVLDSAKGEIIWSRDIKGIAGLSLCDDRIIYSSSDGEIGALDFLNGDLKAKNAISRHISSAFACSPDYLIAPCEGGIFVADKSLNPVAMLSFPYGISSQPAVSNGEIFFVSNGGYLHSFEFMN
ncbi:MAG: PQQ-like beta-propeller repeat protein, partial [Deltaproteobacteria bacterium]|nr:PQQ-like beta-propeller repeat protein [Deltaproteobacteria bacterium]